MLLKIYFDRKISVSTSDFFIVSKVVKYIWKVFSKEVGEKF